MIITEQHLSELISREEIVSRNNRNQVEKQDNSFKIKLFVFSMIRRLFASKSRDKSAIPSNIALIRNDAIGDYIVSTGALKIIKHHLPDCKIDVFASSKNFDLISKDPLVNNTFLCNSTSLSSIKYSELKKISNQNNYDYVIVLNNSKTTVNAVISSIIGKNADKAIPLFPKRKEIYSKVFNRQIHIDNPNFTWAERMNKLVGDVVFGKRNYKYFDPYLFINNDTFEFALNFAKTNKLNYHLKTKNIIFDKETKFKTHNGDKYTVFNISAGKQSNILSTEKCVDILKAMDVNYPDRIIYLSCSPDDISRAEKIVKTINKQNVRLFTSNLMQFIAFLSGADLLITPDTAVSHIAAVTGVKSVILYPSEFHLVYWRPHTNRRVMLLSPDNQTVNSIDTDEIMQAIEIINNKK